MSAGTTPIFPATPLVAAVSLVAASAGTSRAPTAYASMGSTPIFGFSLVASQTNGARIDKITVKNSATAIAGATTAGTVLVWLVNTAGSGYVIDEILITAVTPSASVASATASATYTNLVIPTGWEIWVSGTIAGAAAANALVVTAFGGAY